MSDAAVVGLLHPGEMGSAVGATLVASGARVLWASAGRGAQSRERAAALGLEDAGSLDALTRQAGTILSVAPPHAAVEVAREVAARGYRGVFVDANAIAPGTTRDIAFTIHGVPSGTYRYQAWKPGSVILTGSFAADTSRTLDIAWP